MQIPWSIGLEMSMGNNNYKRFGKNQVGNYISWEIYHISKEKI
jgi:hypothetical protein